MGIRCGFMATLGKGVLLGLAAWLVIAGTAQANHNQEEEKRLVQVVVRDGTAYRGGPVEIPVGIYTNGQVVTSFFMEFYFPGAYLPSVTTLTSFPEGWDVQCAEHPVGMMRCIGAKAEGDVLMGNYIALHFQVSDYAVGRLEVRMYPERLSFFNGPTRLPAKGSSGTITVLAAAQCPENKLCVI